jgi:hypothetical protein
VVNAVGSTIIGEGPHFWAGPCEVGGAREVARGNRRASCSRRAAC